MARPPTPRRPSRRAPGKRTPPGLWGEDTLTIERMSQEGRGVARRNGKIVFVTGALAGEQVRAQCTAVRKGFDEALMTARVADTAPCADRVQPQCPVFGNCGGCSLQHWSTGAQQQHKQAMLQALLRPVFPGELDPPILGRADGFRHRLRLLATRDARQGFLLGLRQHRSREAVNITQCLVANPALNTMLQALPHRLRSVPGLQGLREVEIDADSDNRIGLCFYFTAHPGAKNLAALGEAVMQYPVVALRVRLYKVNKPRGDGQFDDTDDDDPKRWQELKSEGELCLLPEGHTNAGSSPTPALRLTYLPGDFTQTQWAVNTALVARALDWLRPGCDEHALDLFAGVGNFSLPLARKAKSVHTFESDSSMTSRVRANAARNGIGNVHATTLNLITDEVRLPDADVAILDPPRAGAKAVCEALAKTGTSRLLYVSCHPATMLRDARILLDAGFRISRAAAVDMFPHTGHSEAVVLFQRN